MINAIKPPARWIEERTCTATAFARPLPSALIIGGQRCGTGAAHHYLKRHPGIDAARVKEVHYFDVHFHRGLRWYRSHFGNSAKLAIKRRIAGTPIVSCEASPYYLTHPLVPGRVRDTLGAVKLVVLLRDPVSRAYSQYHHEVRKGNETLSFEDALDAEGDRLAGELERITHEPGYVSYAHRHFSYATRGLYAEQLTRWFDVFDKEQLLVLFSEDFYRAPERQMARVVQFLDLPPMPGDVNFRRPKHSAYKGIDRRVTDSLRKRYAESDDQLADLLGQPLPWR